MVPCLFPFFCWWNTRKFALNWDGNPAQVYKVCCYIQGIDVTRSLLSFQTYLFPICFSTNVKSSSWDSWSNPSGIKGWFTKNTLWLIWLTEMCFWTEIRRWALIFVRFFRRLSQMVLLFSARVAPSYSCSGCSFERLVLCQSGRSRKGIKGVVTRARLSVSRKKNNFWLLFVRIFSISLGARGVELAASAEAAGEMLLSLFWVHGHHFPSPSSPPGLFLSDV